MFNALSGACEPFPRETSVTPNVLKWYSCGPTVYDKAHLGHARAYVSQDILRRVAERTGGYKVQLVMGVTDVDDKIIHRAHEQRVSFRTLARQQGQQFFEDMARLYVRPPSAITRVSEHLPEIIKYVEQIQLKGFAYEAVDGSGVYFNTQQLGPKYGKLDPRRQSQQDEEVLAAVEESDVGEEEEKVKKDPKDFALWKAAKEEGEPAWPSPWGMGRPGWHIECSAMTHYVLGEKLDVHTGGVDLRFPHHNNEIAQCEAHNHEQHQCGRDEEWCKHFVHFGHLYIRGRKMSKSLKNFISVRDFLEQGHTADHFRLFCLQFKYPSAEATALAWDSLKLRIATDCKRCKRQARRRGVNTYRQKRRRLYKQLAAAERVGCQRLDPVETITAQLDGLSLNPPEGLTNAQRVRRRIAELQADRAAYKTTRRFREHTWHEGRPPRNLFRRVSTKFADNTVPALVPGPGLPVGDIHDKADTFADAWAPIFCKDPPAESSIHELLSLLDPPPCTDNSDELARPITEDEVAVAIKACKPGKACGPDRLCNDWYRDFAEALTPLLTRLFNQWYDNGVFPASFLEADIFCLKKGGDQSNPLNYRPLALLNSDYKLFTRVLATRTSPTLASIIHPNQAGFVPGRQLHDTVDLYSAAKVTAESDPSQQDALAMLLDFAKAYDSLARLFLMMVLVWLGYPAKFIKTLDFLHSGTTIRFLVNGLKSRPVAVTCGIRQGCPLAPLLFILALEPFYRLIELAAGISGICLVTACTSVILKVAGYADDTAVYLGSPAEVPSLLDTDTAH